MTCGLYLSLPIRIQDNNEIFIFVLQSVGKVSPNRICFGCCSGWRSIRWHNGSERCCFGHRKQAQIHFVRRTECTQSGKHCRSHRYGVFGHGTGLSTARQTSPENGSELLSYLSRTDTSGAASATSCHIDARVYAIGRCTTIWCFVTDLRMGQ